MIIQIGWSLFILGILLIIFAIVVHVIVYWPVERYTDEQKL